MALAADSQTKICALLGYPFRTLDPSSRNYPKPIADSFGNLSTAEEAYVLDVMSKIEGLDERLEDALDRLAAKKVDDIETNERELGQLRAERNRLIRELAQNLDIPVLRRGGMNVQVIV